MERGLGGEVKHLLLLCLLLLSLTACNLITTTAPTPTPQATTSAPTKLTIAYVENGNLMLWQEGDSLPRRIASGGVIRPYLAPDGANVVFTRGPQNLEESLWVVDSNGTSEQELVGRDDFVPRRGGTGLVGQVVWLDERILYYNTLERVEGEAGIHANDDLYRANIRTREVALILNPGDGGRITLSPNRQQIAVVYPGTYGVQDGRIRVVDLLGQEQGNLLFFEGVSTASEYNFYPSIFWLPDSSAVYTAIPDKDVVYDESKPTQLWRLPVDIPQNREMMGTATTSFFALPQWSATGEYIAYLQRVGDPTSNRFELEIAATNGANAMSYVTGNAGFFEPAQWIPDTNRFVYAHGNPGTYWMGAPGETPQRLPNERELMITPLFLDSSTYIFVTPPTSTGSQIRYARLDQIGADSTLLVETTIPYPAFDAVIGN
jgi:hypothetical protein